jgi:nucleotide-binding universal stress UspA family protein
MFDTVMVPTDGSKCSLKAEDVAVFIAKKFNSKLVVVHIVDEKLTDPFDDSEEEGNAILDKAAHKGKQEGLEVEQILIIGNPVYDMEMIVKKSGADLLVIGEHGKTGSTEFIGSVAENTLKTVKVPVLLVK